MPNRTINCVLFDLDGTFADTAPDLAHALNQTLLAHNKAPLTLEQIRPVVSHGGKALIELGFNITESDKHFQSLRQELLDYYKTDLAVHTQLFDGIKDVLSHFKQSEICWGIVTNKPGWLTEPLMEALGIYHDACSIISGDTLTEKKPHPAPLLHAAKQCQKAPASCLYIGDAERDIIAGKRAGMPTMVANYGYINFGENPADWKADVYIDHPLEIIDWLIQTNNHQQTNERTII